MSGFEDAIARLRDGQPAVLIDEERTAEGWLVTAPGADASSIFARHAVGAPDCVFDAASAPAILPAWQSADGLAVQARPAQAHGVLGRAGPAEAAVDALRIAGRPAVALIARLDVPGGVLAGADAVARTAERLALPVLTLQDVIAYRLSHETIVDAEASARLPSVYADQPLEIRAFRGRLDGIEHVALIHGPLGRAPLVRLHSECLTGDALGSLRCDCGDQLRRALHLVAEHPEGGVVVYLRGQEGRGIGLVNKIRAYALQDLGRDTVEANEDLGFPADLRGYGVAVQILQHLGIGAVRLLSNNPRKAQALERYGIVVAEHVGLDIGRNPYNAAYLETKRVKLGHVFGPPAEEVSPGLSDRLAPGKWGSSAPRPVSLGSAGRSPG